MNLKAGDIISYPITWTRISKQKGRIYEEIAQQGWGIIDRIYDPSELSNETQKLVKVLPKGILNPFSEDEQIVLSHKSNYIPLYKCTLIKDINILLEL